MRRRTKIWLWVAGAVVVLLAAVAAVFVVPILLHEDKGVSRVVETDEEWPQSVTAVGEDGRTRTIMVMPAEAGAEVDTSALQVGERIVVAGSGFDVSQGIYVAICKAAEVGVKPGPCLGGVPDTSSGEQEVGTVQFAPSNWINDDWAWKLFGARGYDDAETGTFTAYLEVPSPEGDGVDCRVDRCVIATRNDHTALGDRVQDVQLPIGFAD
ncbi:hypothetical protein [Microbacterium sp. GXF7504]